MRISDIRQFADREFSVKLSLAEWLVLAREPPAIRLGVLDRRHGEAYQKYLAAREKALKRWAKEAPE